MAFANVNVTVTEPNVTVSSDNVNVTVGTTVSNVTVGNATVVSATDVRTKISVQNVSGFGTLAYDNSTASNGIIQYTGVSNAQVISTLSGGNGIDVNPSGEIAVDSSVVRVDQTKTGNVAFTGNVTGAYILGDGSQLTGIDSNADVKAYIESTGLNATADLTTTANVNAAILTTTGNATIGANLNVAGNLEVTGNINYREVEDLLVRDQTITLNFGNASAQDAQIIVDRSGSALANVDLKWNETTDTWQFTNDGSTYNNIGETTGNASGLSKAVTSPATGDGIVKWTDHGDGTGNWQANYLTANVATLPIHNIVLDGSSNTFLQAAANVSWGLPSLTTDIGRNDTFTGSAPSQIFVKDYLFTNSIQSYDTSDGVMVYNGTGATGDAITLNFNLRTTNDAGTLNPSGMTIYGNQGATGPGTGSRRSIVSYDGMGNVHTYLDEAGLNNANTNTNHFTIYGNGIYDPVFKVEQNSDITIGGVTTSDSNITTSANVSASHFIGDGRNVNLDYYQGTLGVNAAGVLTIDMNPTSGIIATPIVNPPNNATLSVNFTGGNNYANIDIYTTTLKGDGSDNTAGYKIYGKQGATGRGSGNNRKLVTVDGIGDFEFDLDQGDLGDQSGAGGHDYTTNTFKIVKDSGAGANDTLFTVGHSGNTSIYGNVTAPYFIGDGSLLTNLPDDTISETVARLCIATETITKGQAVCITGGTGDNPNVSLTNASNVSLMPAIGIALENIASSATGNIALYGEVFGIDTSVFAVGESLYISASIAGALTNVAPTGEENLIQKVGKVVRSNANGIVMVQGAGRTNATPNLDSGNIFLGSTSNTQRSVTPSNNFNTLANAFDLSNTITNVNSITAETGSNITLSTTGQVVAGNISAPGTDNLVLKGGKIEFKQIIDGTSQQYANVSASGYKLLGFSSAPTDVGTLEFEAWGMGGTAVAGSPVFTVTNIGSIREILNNNGYGAGSADGQNRFGQLVAGQVLASFSGGSFPFPSGTRLVSVNAGANQITLSQNAIDSASLTTGYGSLNGLIISDGAYNDTSGAQFAFISEYQVLGAGSNANVDVSTFINSNEHEEGYLFAKTGPALADLTYTKGTSANYTGMAFNTQGQFEFSGNEAFQTSELGSVIGNGGTLTEKMDVDNIPSFGQNIFWSGENNLQDNYGVAPFASSPLYSSFPSSRVQVTPTIGIKSYTANTTQATTPAIGPRLSFTSQNGKASDNPYDTYPLEGQELGRIQWNATRSNRLTADNTKSPVYISSVARNFVSKEEADFYIVGSSEFSNLYREPFLSYEKGNLILASGTQSGAYQPITFAPAQAAGGSGSTPAGTYDFNADGNPSWLAVNYANVTTSKGAKTSVTNGGTYGQTATGDLQLGINRIQLANVAPTNYTMSGGFMANNGAFGGSPGDQAVMTINGSPTDGSGVTFYATTGALTAGNGNFYYIDNAYGGTYYKLWQDAGLTVAALITDFGAFSGYTVETNVGDAYFEFATPNDVVAKEWLFDLNKDSNDLKLTDNGVTKVTFADNRTQFNSPVDFRSYTTTEINALVGPQEGDTVYNSTLNQICFYNGTAWQKITSATM